MTGSGGRRLVLRNCMPSTADRFQVLLTASVRKIQDPLSAEYFMRSWWSMDKQGLIFLTSTMSERERLTLLQIKNGSRCTKTIISYVC